MIYFSKYIRIGNILYFFIYRHDYYISKYSRKRRIYFSKFLRCYVSESYSKFEHIVGYIGTMTQYVPDPIPDHISNNKNEKNREPTTLRKKYLKIYLWDIRSLFSRNNFTETSFISQS